MLLDAIHQSSHPSATVHSSNFPTSPTPPPAATAAADVDEQESTSTGMDEKPCSPVPVRPAAGVRRMRTDNATDS